MRMKGTDNEGRKKGGGWAMSVKNDNRLYAFYILLPSSQRATHTIEEDMSEPCSKPAAKRWMRGFLASMLSLLG
jgi:hypothetical protein